MAQEIVFGQVLQQLMDERYKRNRAALAEAVHLSPSSLSQYVRGRATPSLDVLVHLADVLGVSLDYLVFGQERSAPPPELGYLAGHLEAHIRNAHEQAAAMHDLTARIAAQTGAQMASLIQSAAEKLIADNADVAGTLTPAEIAVLERCDVHTMLVMPDLNTEVLVFEREEEVEDAVIPGFFAHVITENILEGNHYEYIAPQRTAMRHTGNLLRQEVIRLSRLDPAVVDRLLQIRYVTNACIPGFVIHHLALDKLHTRAHDLVDQVRRFIYPDPNDETMGYVATVTPASPHSQRFSLIVKEDVPSVISEFEAFRRRSSRAPNTVK